MKVLKSRNSFNKEAWPSMFCFFLRFMNVFCVRNLTDLKHAAATAALVLIEES